MFPERHSLCSKQDIPRVRGKTFLVFDERHSLCSNNDIPCVRRKIFLVFKERHSLCSKKEHSLCSKEEHSFCSKKKHVFEDDETPIFGRTDLRKGVSEAKFDVEAAGDVKKCLAPPKSTENHEKPKKNPKKNSEKNFPASKNRKLQIVRNAFSRSFAAIGAKFEG